jgi:hypothetical protein
MDDNYASIVCATRGFYIVRICPIFPKRDIILNRSPLYHSSCHLDVHIRSERSTKQVQCAVGRHVFTQQIITLAGLDVIICPPETWTGFVTYSQHHVFCPFNTDFLFRCLQLSELCNPLHTPTHCLPAT